MSEPVRQPVGAILAGGLGRRLGGEKAITRLAGRALIDYPLQILRAVLEDVVVVAKAETSLPELPGVPVWTEPAEPHHPLVGIVYALERADGRSVLICAADLPLITVDAVRSLAEADALGAPAVVAGDQGTIQPLLARYEPVSAALLAPAARAGQASVREAVAVLEPRLLELGDPELLFNVNTPAELARAEVLLRARASGPPAR